MAKYEITEFHKTYHNTIDIINLGQTVSFNYFLLLKRKGSLNLKS